jgi:hypothetical protein
VTRIEHQAAEWLGLLDDQVRAWTTRGMGLDRLLQRIGGLHAGLTDLTLRRDLERDVRRWWAQARVVTGWDSPAWRPDNSCPMCAEHGTLRVRLAEKVGLCTECRETWDETNIGLLADHIREESAAARPPLELVLCWCPWPAPPFEFRAGGWGALCPACGSKDCHRARPARPRDPRHRSGPPPASWPKPSTAPPIQTPALDLIDEHLVDVAAGHASG